MSELNGKLRIVITWFDALLVTLLAVVTALGARRGLAGFAWGIGGLITVFVANSLGLGVGVSTLLALALGAAFGWAISRLIQDPQSQPWFIALGGLGGLILGGILISTLALNFPIEIRATTQGKQGVYPSTNLTPSLYEAVHNSAIQNALQGVWGAGKPARTLLVPDQVQ